MAVCNKVAIYPLYSCSHKTSIGIKIIKAAIIVCPYVIWISLVIKTWAFIIICAIKIKKKKKTTKNRVELK